VAGYGVLAATCLILMPLSWGLVSVARRLSLNLAEQVLPPTQSLDTAAAPRRVLLLALQIGILIIVGIPVVAVTQPFLPPFGGALVLVPPLAVLGVMLWRSANNLQGHVRAGAAVILEVLANQSHEPSGPDLTTAEILLPGIGSMESVRIGPQSPAVGRTLAMLNLRGLTGATVVALQRGEQGTVAPTGHEPLLAGDVLAMIGSEDAINAARRVLHGRGADAQAG